MGNERIEEFTLPAKEGRQLIKIELFEDPRFEEISSQSTINFGELTTLFWNSKSSSNDTLLLIRKLPTSSWVKVGQINAYRESDVSLFNVEDDGDLSYFIRYPIERRSFGFSLKNGRKEPFSQSITGFLNNQELYATGPFELKPMAIPASFYRQEES